MNHPSLRFLTAALVVVASICAVVIFAQPSTGQPPQENKFPTPRRLFRPRTESPSTAPVLRGPAPSTPDPSLTVDKDIAASANTNIFKDGTPWLWDDANNLALGREALTSNTTGIQNTAIGRFALASNQSGYRNTSLGYKALANNYDATLNTAIGVYALYNTTYSTPYSGYGSSNVAVGGYAMNNNTEGFGNVAIGTSALLSNPRGHLNTAVGRLALNALGYYGGPRHSNNIALGADAGSSMKYGSNNILIGNSGMTDEDDTIRIGFGQSQTFIAGILGNTTAGTHYVNVGADGQVVQGNALVSSARFKEEIRDLGSVSERLLDLRPVTFRFNEGLSSPGDDVQFGLIAEEVAETFPELVQYDEEGRPHTVKYRSLSALLLNELQRQHTRFEALEARLARLEHPSSQE